MCVGCYIALVYIRFFLLLCLDFCVVVTADTVPCFTNVRQNVIRFAVDTCGNRLFFAFSHSLSPCLPCFGSNTYIHNNTYLLFIIFMCDLEIFGVCNISNEWRRKKWRKRTFLLTFYHLLYGCCHFCPLSFLFCSTNFFPFVPATERTLFRYYFMVRNVPSHHRILFAVFMDAIRLFCVHRRYT